MKKYELKGSRLYVRLPGELDHASSEELKKETDHIFATNNVKSVVFDFGDTRFMDSSGLGVLMSRFRKLGMAKGCVAAVHADERIQKIFRISGMYKIIQLEENSNEA